MLMVLLGLLRVCMLFNSNGYLSAPFVFDIGDTFMDWFNTAYNAHNGNAYDVWRTIYLPLSFVLTGALGNPRCYNSAPYDARDCDVFGIVVILLIYVACIVVSGIAFWRRDRSTALYRTIAIGLGGPMLYALERGQLIMFTFVAFVLLYGDLIKSRSRFAAAAAFMANTKVYMVFPLFALALRRDWRMFELCLIAALGLYLTTLLIVGGGTPLELLSNLENWFGLRLGTVWDEMLYTTTYRPLLQLDIYQYPVRDYIEQRWVDMAVVFVEGYVVVSRLLCWLCIAFSWLYPRAISTTRLVFFILMQSFIGQNPGGYAIALIIFLVFMEKDKKPVVMFAIICAYLISIPGDLTLVKLFDIERFAWLSKRTVMSEYVVPWGALIRPGVIAMMLWALAIDTLINVHRAMQKQRPELRMLLRGRTNDTSIPQPVGTPSAA